MVQSDVGYLVETSSARLTRWSAEACAAHRHHKGGGTTPESRKRCGTCVPSASTPAQPSTEPSATPRQQRERARRKSRRHSKRSMWKGHLMRSLCRLKARLPPLVRWPHMDPGHMIAELVIGRGFADHRRTNVEPVCELTNRMHRRVTFT